MASGGTTTYTTVAGGDTARRAMVPTSASYDATGGQLAIGNSWSEKIVSCNGKVPWSTTHCDRLT